MNKSDNPAPISGDAPKESLEEAAENIFESYFDFKDVPVKFYTTQELKNDIKLAITEALRNGAAYQHKVTQAETLNKVDACIVKFNSNYNLDLTELVADINKIKDGI